ncbi:MerR family transcriptional regulator [Paenibacillus kyungheensis]
MKLQLLTIQNILHITGITKKTLHHYHKIGLLPPSHIADNGYRFYDRQALATLQTILLFKEMGFSLTEIATMLPLSKAKQTDILIQQRQLLESKKQKLTTVIEQLDHYIEGTDISKLTLFDDSTIPSIEEQYELEAKLVYGDTKIYQEFQGNIEKLSDSDKKQAYNQFTSNMESVFRNIALYQDRSPSDDKVQQYIDQWSQYLAQFIGDDICILLCIAETYRTDERFVRYFDTFGEEGYLIFLYKAIVYFVEKKSNTPIADS